MKKIWYLVLPILFFACKSNAPDVSHLDAQVEIRRFDQDFFAMDTLQLMPSLQQVAAKYPDFFTPYMANILGIPPGSEEAPAAISSFLNSYRPVYDRAQAVAGAHLPDLKEDLEQSLKYLQYYLPQFQPEKPFNVTTFIGPMDAYEPFAIGDYGDVRTTDGVGIALQFHLGENDPIYVQGNQAGMLYQYQTRRFTPEMMLVNSMKNVIEDLFPLRQPGLNLVESMVEKGKRLYLLKQVLPHTPDSLQYGYTTAQLEGAERQEALIWNFFVKNDLLYSKDELINKNYNQDGPYTHELGEGSPGYITLFVGRRIVESYMEKFPETTIPQLMQKPARQLFQESAYKP